MALLHGCYTATGSSSCMVYFRIWWLCEEKGNFLPDAGKEKLPMNDKESDMEEIEKRLEVLEEGMTQRRVVEHQILDIVERTDQTIQRIERKQDELIGSLRSLQAQQTIFDARLSILDTRQKDDLSAINARFDRISEKNDKIFQALQSHDQFAELREKVEVQIEGKITGLQTEMHQSFDRQDKQIADLRGDMNVQLNEIKLLFAALVPKPDQGAWF